MEVVGWQRLHQSVWGSLHQVAPAPSERHRAPIPAPGPVSTFFVIGSGLLAPGGSASRGTAPAPRRGTAHEDLIVKTRWLDPGFLRFCRTSTSGEGYPAAGVSIGSGGKMEVWKKPPARSSWSAQSRCFAYIFIAAFGTKRTVERVSSWWWRIPVILIAVIIIRFFFQASAGPSPASWSGSGRRQRRSLLMPSPSSALSWRSGRGSSLAATGASASLSRRTTS